MATAICAKSGLRLTISHIAYHFDGSPEHGSVMLQHPIFNLDYSALTHPQLLDRWIQRQMNETDTKLYFLALLNSTNLVQWHCPAQPSLATCESNMTGLLDILDWLNTIHHPRLSMPHVAISEDTANLPNVDQWIRAWNQARADFENGYVALTRTQLMMRKEETLARLIKTQHTELSSYAGMLADWANLAAEFPATIRDYNGKQVSAAEYWKLLIITCAKSESHIWRLHVEDLQELLDYLEDNLDAGSIYGHAVIKLVRSGIAKHSNYLGFTVLGDAPAETGQPNNAGTMQPNATEYAFSKILASDAPESEPLRHNYPNQIAYLKDKIRWQQAQKLLSTTFGEMPAPAVSKDTTESVHPTTIDIEIDKE